MDERAGLDEAAAGSRQALRRVLACAGGEAVLDALAAELSGSDLTTLLLEVFRRRAELLSPADVLRRYRTDRFVAAAAVDFAALRNAEDAMLGALPDGFERARAGARTAARRPYGDGRRGPAQRDRDDTGHARLPPIRRTAWP